MNRSSRRGDKIGAIVAAELQSLGYQPVVLEASDAAAVESLLINERANLSRLIVVGGDGLIHHTLTALAGSEIILGVVSSGTGNDVARSLGLPRKTKAAVAAALTDPTAIDLLRITAADGSVRWAASVATAGFSGRVNAVANGLSFPRGQQKYTVATLLEARRLEPFSLTGSVDGVAFTSRCTFFAVGNTRHFGGGMAICPDADFRDGALDLTLVDEISRFALLRMLPTVFPGRHVRHPAVRTLRGTAVELDFAEALWADGELIGRGPVSIEAIPEALRVAGVR